MLDAWRLAVGTLTAIRVKPPAAVTRAVAGTAMLLAPLAVVPLALVVALVLWLGRELELAPIAVAMLAVGLLAAGSRAFHLDGLADTADGLTSSYDRERSLAVMKTGDTGPAGAAALVVVLGVQAGALVSLTSQPNGPWLAALLICVSRGAVAITCVRGIPAARRDGLGETYVGSVSPALAAGTWLVLTALMCGGFVLVDEPWWRGLVCTGVAVAVIALVIRRAVNRLAGVTGDIFGACIELSLAALLLVAS